MQSRWIFPDELNKNQRWTCRVKMEVHPFVEELLSRRGVEGNDAQREFLSDKPALTHDPFLLKGMEEGVALLLAAIDAGEKICIYGDYDADGICATSLILQILGLLGADTEYYIPSRFAEGYGLNMDAIADIHSRGASLILTVDCGSVSVEEVEFAKSLGLKMLVTDHHSMGGSVCDCVLINPKQPGCTYPEKELCGCGVAFKLAQALQRKTGDKITKKDLNDVLDLVVLATMGDVVPLRGENRTLAKFGMKALNRRKRPGLDLLIREAGLTPGEIKGDDIAYVIVPHLNAGGRMMTAKTGVDVLMASDEAAAAEPVALLIRNNQERKSAQEDALGKALDTIEGWKSPGRFLLVDVPDAHEGIAGIVAGKLKDMYYCPAAILTQSGEDYLKGSGRSPEGIDLYGLLSDQAHLFSKFGGHAGACGFMLPKENLEILREALNQAAEALYLKDPDLFSPTIYIDGILNPEDVSPRLMDDIQKMGPFGFKNPEPCLCLPDREVTNMWFMGDQEQHVRFNIGGLNCILFRRAAEFRELLESGPVDIAGKLRWNRYNGRERMQFVIDDIRRNGDYSC